MKLASAFCISLLGVAACGDVSGPAAEVDSITSQSLVSPPRELLHSDGLPRFAVSLTAAGTMRPGSQIQIVGAVRALIPTEHANVRLSFPDIEIAERSGWRPEKMRVTGQLPYATSVTRALASQEEISVSATALPMKPGYYRAVLVAEHLSPDASLWGGHWVQDVAIEEVWLYVDVIRGRVTTEFDTLVFSPSEVPAPGVRRERAAAGLGRDPNTGIIDSNSPTRAEAVTLAPMMATASAGWGQGSMYTSGYLGVYVEYFDQYANAFRPVVGVSVGADVYAREQYGDELIGGYSATTDQLGEAIWPCPPSQNEYHVATVSLFHTWVEMEGVPPSGPVYAESSNCEYVYFSIELPSMETHVFLNMADRIVPASRALLGRSRGRILVDVDPDVSNSYYTKFGFPSGKEYIKLRPSAVWGPGGLRTQAHEYGHAVHEKALGGNVASGQCPSPHYFHGYYNVQCAYSEGFANYHAAATMGAAAEFTSTFENFTLSSWFDPAKNGALSEAAVAAFLYDLTDPANEAWDTVQYPGSYVGNMIVSCQVFTNMWRRADGVDQLIYCLERTVDLGVRDGYFGSQLRSGYLATHQSSSGTLPTGWSRDAVRELWKKNLFGL